MTGKNIRAGSATEGEYMMHENDEILQLIRALAGKVLELDECAKKGAAEDCMARFALDDAAYMARLVTAELGDYAEGL
jgi:hypothetical protein